MAAFLTLWAGAAAALDSDCGQTIVIGAGAAGLAAAQFLEANGCEVYSTMDTCQRYPALVFWVALVFWAV